MTLRIMRPSEAESESMAQGAGRYGIVKIMCRDGSTIPCAERVFKRGTFYAASSQQNSAEHFFAVEMDSYSALGGRNIEFLVYAETTPAKNAANIPAGPVARVHKSNSCRAVTIICNKLRQ